MSDSSRSIGTTNRWGWQFMQADGLSVAAMNRGTKKARSGPPAASPPPSMFGNLMSTIGQGFAFGTGSEVAHKVVDTVVNSPSVIKLETSTTDELIRDIGLSCGYFKASYDDCVYNDKRECEKINVQYRECLEILKKYDNVILT